MTATTDILPFATSGVANVETQAAYAADPTTGTGFASGTASSLKLNKVWRQSSFMAAVVANWEVLMGYSVPDDGNLSNAVTAFNNSVKTAIELFTGDYSVDTGTANAYVIALSPPVTAYPNGLKVKFKIAHTNTAASTLNAGAGPVPLVNDLGNPVVANDLPVGFLVGATYDLSTNSFIITQLLPSQIANSVPGQIITFAGSSAPNGYLVCPTSVSYVNATTYSNLASALGLTWGSGGTSVTAGSFIIGQTYIITSLGTTNFTLIGASSNAVGVVFTATGVGSGTGTATSQVALPWFPADYTFSQASSNVGTQTVGQNLSHTHGYYTYDQPGIGNAGGGGARVNASVSQTLTQTPAGGTANLAAGSRVLFCVKY